MALPTPSPSTTALVTGASSGIGREIARQLAARGHGVTLVARRRELLEELAAELRAGHGVRVEVLPADLTDQAACDALVEQLDELGLEVDVLVNNAGFGVYSGFATSDADREFEQLALLVGAVVQLNKHFFPRMVARGRGAIINMSSTSAFQPLPGNANYAASKVFVLFHSEALHEEARGTGVTVTAVCPGPVRTEFQDASDPLFTDSMPRLLWASAERVARDALRAADKGKRTVVPGALPVKAFFGPNRFMPVGLTNRVTRRMMSGELARGGEAPPLTRA